MSGEPSDEEKLAELAKSDKVKNAVGPLLEALRAAAGSGATQSNGTGGKGKGI